MEFPDQTLDTLANEIVEATRSTAQRLSNHYNLSSHSRGILFRRYFEQLLRICPPKERLEVFYDLRRMMDRILDERTEG